MTPAERQHRARLAAHSRWARPYAREEQAEHARRAIYRRFENLVDPDGVLSPADRDRAVNSALRAHSARMHLARRRNSPNH
jgi:hypothetical protein